MKTKTKETIEEIISAAKDPVLGIMFPTYFTSLFIATVGGFMEGYSTAKGVPAYEITLASGAISSASLLALAAIEEPELLQESYYDKKLSGKKVAQCVGSAAAIPAITYSAGFLAGKIF